MKLALFDIDGTLVDSQAIIVASMSRVFADEGLPVPPRDRLVAGVGLSLTDMMATLVPDADRLTLEQLGESYKRVLWQNRLTGDHREELFPGARELLARLQERDDVLLGIATGKSRRGISHLETEFGIAGWFTTVQTADEHPSKPDPAMIAAALAETGVPPQAAVMIGDTSFDMAMARAAGVRAIGVTWGNHPAAELTRAGADAVVASFAELEERLAALWAEAGA